MSNNCPNSSSTPANEKHSPLSLTIPGNNLQRKYTKVKTNPYKKQAKVQLTTINNPYASQQQPSPQEPSPLPSNSNVHIEGHTDNYDCYGDDSWCITMEGHDDAQQAASTSSRHQQDARNFNFQHSNKFSTDHHPQQVVPSSNECTFQQPTTTTPLFPRNKNDSIYHLSAQQIAVLDEARSPLTDSDNDSKLNDNSRGRRIGKIVRVTAAAGAGKTFTLMTLADRLVELGHGKIVYCTFNKAASVDAAGRWKTRGGACGVFDPKTLHALALKLVSKSIEKTTGTRPRSMPIKDIKFMKNYIAEKFERSIDNFLRDAYDCLHKKNEKNRKRRRDEVSVETKKKRCFDRAVFFIYKFFEKFCRSASTLSDFRDHNITFYPARSFHTADMKAEAMGFLHKNYGRGKISKTLEFYSSKAYDMWLLICEKKIYSFDILSKKSQLECHEVDCSAILVDESQDLDGAQSDWISKQIRFGSDVFFVGDAAQQIYGFRGGNSEHFMNIPDAIDLKLTQSFRFGNEIARVANVVLFGKEFSPQTTSEARRKRRQWIPYRVTGVSSASGVITKKCILDYWKTKGEKVTVLARHNAALLLQAMNIFVGQYTKGSEETSLSSESKSASYWHALKNNCEKIPKISLNGGSNSGWKKFVVVVKQVKELYKLYPGPGGGEKALGLDPKLFPDWAGISITWSQFQADVSDADEDLGEYAAAMQVIQIFGEDTLEVIQVFEKEVLMKKYSTEEADIIMSTAHSAKGMEWDNVYVCDDSFLDMKKFQDLPINSQLLSSQTSNAVKAEKAESSPKSRFSSTDSTTTEHAWQFRFSPFGDDVNLLYVALTRAKRILRVPIEFVKMLEELDRILACSQSEDIENLDDQPLVKFMEEIASSTNLPLPYPPFNEIPHDKDDKMGIMPKTPEEFKQFAADIIYPLRSEGEVAVAEGESLVKAVMTGDVGLLHDPPSPVKVEDISCSL